MFPVQWVTKRHHVVDLDKKGELKITVTSILKEFLANKKQKDKVFVDLIEGM